MTDRAPGGGSWHFLGDLAIALTLDDGRATGALEAVPEICAPGHQRVRTGVLCTMADVVAGRLAALRTAPRLSVTVDLACVVHLEVKSGAVSAVARLLKAGRTTIVTETRFHAAGESNATESPGSHFATCLTTFVASGRPGDVLRSAARKLPIAGDGRPTLRSPVLDRLGAVERAPGVLVTELVRDVVNSAGLMQGGAVALLADGAAQSAADAGEGAEGVEIVHDLDVRYLDALRVGPVETSATLLGERDDGQRWWRVELRDAGNDDRLGTVALARTAPSRRTLMRTPGS